MSALKLAMAFCFGPYVAHARQQVRRPVVAVAVGEPIVTLLETRRRVGP